MNGFSKDTVTTSSRPTVWHHYKLAHFGDITYSTAVSKVENLL